ncbi:MAG: hypothetical protein ACKOH8_03335, partial [Gemmatimonadota bacterium]
PSYGGGGLLSLRPGRPLRILHAPFVSSSTSLRRDLGFLGLTATGVCSMVGASIHIMPFLVQVTVPGIGPWVLPAFAFAALPAFLAALAYAALA